MTAGAGLFIVFWAAPGKADELLNALRAMLPVVRDEPGTLAYDLHRIVGDREGVAVYELYADAEAQRAHGESTAIEALKARLPGLLAAPPERYDLLPVGGAEGLSF